MQKAESLFKDRWFLVLLISYVALLAFSAITLWNILNNSFGILVANAGYVPLSTYCFPWIISILWALGHLGLAYVAIGSSIKTKPMTYKVAAPLLGTFLPLILLFFGISWLSNARVLSWLYFFAGTLFLAIATYIVTLAK